MDLISLETDSMTQKYPDNMYHTKCFMKNKKTSKLYDDILRPFWNFTHKKRLPTVAKVATRLEAF